MDSHRPMTQTGRVQALFDWLVDGCPGATTPMDVLARVGPDLRAADIPVDRLVAFVKTLHPHVAGRAFSWTPGNEVRVEEVPWVRTDVTAPSASPVRAVFETGREIRVKVNGTEALPFADLTELRTQGFVDYCALPLRFMGGTIHCISLATRAPSGFSPAQLEVVRHVLRPLTRVAEVLALMRTAVNLLNAYVGRDAGDRILKGHVQRGDTETIQCVIWFSDLRGFTSFSSEHSPGDIIRVLNQFFDCQVPAIERYGGQVLKFIGDGLLAIFPIGPARETAEVGADAIRAAEEAFTALAQLNATRARQAETPLQFGVALHVGEVAYGNIGGANRLDFTAIGPAVNLASRIEGLTAALGKRLLLSEPLAYRLRVPVRPVGQHEVKGLSEPLRVFEPGE